MKKIPKVEKNIPLPTKISRGPQLKYPWYDMEIGDSFFTETPIKTMKVAAHNMGKKMKVKFVTKQEKTGSRVWREK